MLNPQQYGFQKDISTAHAVLNTVTSTYDNINKNQFTAIFFLDLKKVFDTVCHKTFLKKLDQYGHRGPVNKLLDSYLQRHQLISLKNTYSTIRLNGYGVQQGSTLGPLLFLLYVNDLPNAVQSAPRLFADDTCLLLSLIPYNSSRKTKSRSVSTVQLV